MSTSQQASFNQRTMVKDLNPHITCGLCRGYLIDATTLIECLHVFCRACVLRHFENKLKCPTCSLVYKKKSYPYFRSDSIVQALVYKLVPGLYGKEMQRREDFYRSTSARASSSCSEDSILGDLNEEHEDWHITSPCGKQYQFLSPDDAVSLSLEYYQVCLDTINSKVTIGESALTDREKNPLIVSVSDKVRANCDSNNCVNTNTNEACGEQIKLEDSGNTATDSEKVCDELDKKKCDRRYLRCPAAVTMWLLQKFLRMKYALSTEHKVDIIYEGEVLPGYFTLIDVVYTFKWQRLKPLRFFYRIFTPVKIQPIKIITTSSGKHKQLQVVPANSHQTTEAKPESANDVSKMDVDDQIDPNKETLMTNLQLQSITKPPQIFTSRLNRHDEPNKARQGVDEEAHCVYEYEEPDKEEIRAFAERRDLEWALQKQLDEAKEHYRISKKRKKSKHKGNVLHKKRKLHAEITSSESLQKEECLKLKVKLTQPNGYKHKHHRNSQSLEYATDSTTPRELSSKEKLLQMRQVRHKHLAIADNVQQLEIAEKAELSPKSSCSEPTPTEHVINNKLPEPTSPSKTLRSDFSNKTNPTKEVALLQKLPTVHLERNAQTEQHAKQTFLKTFQSYTEKPPQKNGLSQSSQNNSEKTSFGATQISKSLEKKIANLHQQCTIIEAKAVKLDNECKSELSVGNEKSLILNSQFSSGFTVSKIETGVKRNSKDVEQLNIQDKRPSLEITLINSSAPDDAKSPTKRPLPATIPLEKIRRSINRMMGVNVIPKVPEVSDTGIALDLSKTNKSPEASLKVAEIPPAKLVNGLAAAPNTSQTPDKNIQLSNLQMLSKVASEHPSINKRPQMPSLNTLRIPNPNSNLRANLAKLPKLNEINKTQFRLPNPQLKNMRPNQNQSIRNIPNPSLLVRQQNQNRLNSLATPHNNVASEIKQNTSESSKGEPKNTEDKSLSTIDKPKISPLVPTIMSV